ncbi:response regulator [Scytonema sp. UIC 10036]|uniref:response regulator n=1 Tax=Scytonema sp. UIC 10036 TaxID=2304196 RepID=UPI0012DACE93|nr:response regulator [Scytonema sp. UIC 10036]MUG94549.1 response regulator [Scytonema sp. UIC 10036]
MHSKSSGEAMELAHAFMSDNKQHDSEPPLILAVEDNDDNLLLLSYALDSLGCRLICQKDSSTTVLVAKEYQPDLILLDILLPGKSGIDLVRSLKQEPLTRHIAAIAITALASAEDRERILMAGFDDYISKPYMIEDLEDMVRSYLRRKLNVGSAFDFCQE